MQILNSSIQCNSKTTRLSIKVTHLASLFPALHKSRGKLEAPHLHPRAHEGDGKRVTFPGDKPLRNSLDRKTSPSRIQRMVKVAGIAAHLPESPGEPGRSAACVTLLPAEFDPAPGEERKEPA
jgi:hypothetical protein